MLIQSLLDQVEICTSVPGKVPLHPTKVNILWQKNSWDQPNLIPGFKINQIMINMIGMYLILIGTLNSLQKDLNYLQKNV